MNDLWERDTLIQVQWCRQIGDGVLSVDEGSDGKFRWEVTLGDSSIGAYGVCQSLPRAKTFAVQCFEVLRSQQRLEDHRDRYNGFR